MSSAFLYLAIVAIWAFVLVPRWLRRSHVHERTTAEPEVVTASDDTSAVPVPVPHKSGVRRHAGNRDDQAVARSRPAEAPLSRAKVLQARRRLLTFLVLLTAAAGACTYLKLTAWWASVPPAFILGVYFLLLRSAALADAEQARRRAATELMVQAARRPVSVEDTEPRAEIIDISDRLSDQVYDQYADATIRAVGD